MEIGNSESILDLSLQAARLQLEIGSLIMRSDQLKRAGNIPVAIGAYGDVIEKSKQQRRVIAQLHEADPNAIAEWSPEIMLNAMSTAADLHETLGTIDEAQLLWNEIEIVSKTLDDRGKEMEFQRQYAAHLKAQGRFNEALVKLQACYEYFAAAQDLLRLAEVTADMADILEWLGDFERSVEYVTEALKVVEPRYRELIFSDNTLEAIARRVHLTKIYVSLRQTLGRNRKLSGDYAGASDCFTEVRPLIPEDGKIGIDFQLATVQIMSKDYARGLDTLKQAEPMFTGIARHKLGVALSWQAEALLGMQNYQEALKMTELALEDLSNYKDPDAEWRTLWRQARILLAMDQRQSALTACGKAVRIVDSLRKSSLGYRFDNLYLSDKMPLMHTAIALAAEAGDAMLCSYFTEVIKSRTLASIFSAGRSKDAAAMSPLEARLWSVTRELDRIEFGGGNAQDHERFLRERDELIDRIRIADSRWSTMAYSPRFDGNALQQLLAARNMVALSLFINANVVCCTLITGQRCDVRTLTLDDDCIAKLNAYDKNLSADTMLAELFDFSGALHVDITRIIPEELVRQALNSSAVIIVPHKVLHLLPWSGMLYQGKRLFEHCPVGIVPNLSCIGALSYTCTNEPKIALIGAPVYSDGFHFDILPEADAELSRLKIVYKERLIDQPRTGKEANVDHFWQLAHHPASDNQILHIACHGDVDPGDPYSASLVFADGRVDTPRLMVSRLRYAEAVLSACSTGYRPGTFGKLELVGDDILSIPGALLEGGVRSVLVSIPPAADDVACDFVVTYQKFRSTLSPLHAFQKTQIEMLRNGAHPVCLWIGFTLYGVV